MLFPTQPCILMMLLALFVGLIYFRRKHKTKIHKTQQTCIHILTCTDIRNLTHTLPLVDKKERKDDAPTKKLFDLDMESVCNSCQQYLYLLLFRNYSNSHKFFNEVW